MLLWKWVVCDSKKLRIIKKQEASGLFSNLGIRTSLSKITPLWYILLKRYKMNEILNQFL